MLELVDPQTDAALVTVEFDRIEAGAQAVEFADLAGVALPGDLAVRLVGGSPGSGGAPVLVDAATSIAVEAAFSALEVSAAEAVIGAQEFLTTFDTDLPSDYAVEQAIIAAGAVVLTVQNQMPIACQAVITWPAIVDLDQTVLATTFDLPPHGAESRAIEFGGRLVQAPAGELLTVLTAEVAVTSAGSGGVPVLLDASMGVQADLGEGRIVFGSVTGNVPEVTYDFDPIEEAIDLPDELAGLNLTRASLVLELTNSSGLTAAADFNLVGVSASGQERSLAVQETIAAADGERAGVTEIVLDETNSSIVDFLNNLPTAIVLEGGLALGGDGQIGTVRPDDHAVVSWRISAPVEVVIDASRLYSDPDSLGLDAGLRDDIANHAGPASVHLRVLNHLPMGVAARVLFGADTLSIKTDPLLAVGPVTVDAAPTDPATHTVTEARLSEPSLSLTAAEVQLLGTAGLYQIIEVTLPSTEGDPVRVLTTDYVEIQGLVDLDVDVHDDRNQD
ncbi:MAG: hypothetical protein R3D98_14115 [Candidatus Krumholzibacteriia bacterium]